jgi:TrmH family RNA methyltransferase
MITSPQNLYVKQVRLLQQRREAREQERLFVAEGWVLVNDLLAAGMTARYALLVVGAATQQWQAQHPGVHCLEISEPLMRAVSQETTPPGVLAVFEMPPARPNVEATASVWPPLDSMVLVLDGLRDPGNMGACLRVAAGADCRYVLLTPGCVDAYNPKVMRGGMGAHARLQIHALSWDELKAALLDRSVWMADASGARAYDEIDWVQPQGSALVIGAEAAGLSPDIHALGTGSVSIPLANGVESLNAAVACGVILFEAARQRRARQH